MNPQQSFHQTQQYLINSPYYISGDIYLIDITAKDEFGNEINYQVTINLQMNNNNQLMNILTLNKNLLSEIYVYQD